MLVGLDNSSAISGWATIIGKQITCGSHKVVGPTQIEKFSNYRAFIRDFIQKAQESPEKIEAVAIEEAIMTNATLTVIEKNPDSKWFGAKRKMPSTSFDTQSALLGIRGICMVEFFDAGIPVHLVRPDEWRLSVMGVCRAPKGSTDKKWLKNRWRERVEAMGVIVPNSDASDAVGVAMWLMAHLRKYPR